METVKHVAMSMTRTRAGPWMAVYAGPVTRGMDRVWMALHTFVAVYAGPVLVQVDTV